MPMPATKEFSNHWKAKGTPRAVVALVHGLGEHINRYTHVARFLNGFGIAVLGADLTGHGRRQGLRGHASGIDTLLDNVDGLVYQCRQHYGDVPLFLYGHSMGGTLVLYRTLFRSSDQVAGVICTSPWLRLPNPPSALLVFAARVLNSVFPAFTQSNGLNPEDLSHDSDVVEAYRNDPLVHNRISARLAVHLTDAAARLDRYSGTFPVPLILMHGKQDRITDSEGSKNFAAKDPEHIEFILWPECRHELHNEPEKEQVFSTMKNWIDAVING